MKVPGVLMRLFLPKTKYIIKINLKGAVSKAPFFIDHKIVLSFVR